MLNGLCQINIELSSRCDKQPLCRFCGHQSPKVNPDLRLGDIDADLLALIARQVPDRVIVQFHRDGEPLVYARLSEALDLFSHCLRSIVTHGGHLGDRAAEIIGHCERVTVSIFDGDPAAPEQARQVQRFLALRGSAVLPALNVKVVGEMSPAVAESWRAFGVPILYRQLHYPGGNWRYRGTGPPIPEAMMCMELLSHPSIDWEGNLYICNRLQPSGEGRLGNLRQSSLRELWDGDDRRRIIRAHVLMQRAEIPACRGCMYWGYPAA